MKQQLRRGVRAVERARLESECRGNSTVGSNPTLSAIFFATQSLTSRNDLQRLNVPLDLPRYFILGNFQFVSCLQVHPESRSIFEISREAERRVRCDAAALV